MPAVLEEPEIGSKPKLFPPEILELLEKREAEIREGRSVTIPLEKLAARTRRSKSHSAA